jgi:hypothetical protein
MERIGAPTDPLDTGLWHRIGLESSLARLVARGAAPLHSARACTLSPRQAKRAAALSVLEKPAPAALACGGAGLAARPLSPVNAQVVPGAGKPRARCGCPRSQGFSCICACNTPGESAPLEQFLEAAQSGLDRFSVVDDYPHGDAFSCRN